jgi:RNA polymerase sigma-70 factor (ECF subfamily)
MEERTRSDVTRILRALCEGEGDRKEHSDRLFHEVYRELRRIAGGMMSRERPDHTLQPTALVHEAYLKLVDQTVPDWQNRAHFFGIAARAMRQILVDHARRHQAEKRGGAWRRVTLDENLPGTGAFTGGAGGAEVEILSLHEALEKLARRDERMARVVELRVFAGLLAREVALVLGVSKRTADEDWKLARMWLARELAGGGKVA